MNYQTAKAIAAEVAPTLIVDDENLQMPALFVVRKTLGGMPFSITLPTVDPEQFPPIAARDAIPEVPAVPATADHPGTPYIPAQPAIAARTTEGQVAEAERASLLWSLNAAMRALPDPAPAQ